MKKLIFLFGFLFLGPKVSSVYASNCLDWTNPERIGTLDNAINEASGMTISQRYPNRIYHINDSGSKGEFFIADFTGHITQTVKINGLNPIDTEDASLGPCGAESCLYIADTGDNLHSKKSSFIYVIKEEKSFGNNTNLFARIKIRYSDQVSHDVEAMAIHPNGDLFIITKEYNHEGGYLEEPKVFWLTSAELWKSQSKVKTMHEIGKLDISAITGNKDFSSLVTSMSISSKGDRFTVLTYSQILEFNFDLSQGFKPEISKTDFSLVPTVILKQQESIEYDPRSDALIYTTEDKGAPLYRVRCNSRTM